MLALRGVDVPPRHFGLLWGLRLETFRAPNANVGGPGAKTGGPGRGLETGPEKGRVLKALSEGVMRLKCSK